MLSLETHNDTSTCTSEEDIRWSVERERSGAIKPKIKNAFREGEI